MARSDHSKNNRAAGKNRHQNGSLRAQQRAAIRRGDWDILPPSVSSQTFVTARRQARP